MTNNFPFFIQYIEDNPLPDGCFYYCQILQRAKENPDLGSNNKTIKTYCIKSEEYLQKKQKEIIDLCNYFNARAYLAVNYSDYRKVALRMMAKLAQVIEEGQYGFCERAFSQAVGSLQCDPNKKWIVDIDTKDTLEIAKISMTIDECEPDGIKTLYEVPTKNGIHLIVRPFNLAQFKKEYPEIEVHKNNPSILYVP